MSPPDPIKQRHNRQLVQVNDPAVELRSLMQRANIPSYRALASQAQVSRWQVQQLRTGNVQKMRVAVAAQLAEALNISISELLSKFDVGSTLPESLPESLSESASQLARLQQEYQRLQQEMAQQQEMTQQQLQTEALQTLETWLVQWPTIVKRAQEKGDALSAVKILPFVRPVEQLIAEWGVAAIAPIDAQVPYDPQIHQLIGGTAAPGDPVRVANSGYFHQKKLLHRSTVKPITP